jgi:hypothetical protein
MYISSETMQASLYRQLPLHNEWLKYFNSRLRYGLKGVLMTIRKYAWYLWALSFFCNISAPFVQAAESTPPAVNAFFLQSIPERYRDLEILFQRLKSGGANTVIARPLKKNGAIDAAALTNLTFLSHKEGLRIFVVLPTRFDSGSLAAHPEWEDIRYDPGSGTLKATGSMDLANPRVLAHLVTRFKEVAAFSVDGILLDEDFRYATTEGLSSSILNEYIRKYGSPFAARKVFEKVSPETTGRDSAAFDASFWQWSELKRDAVVNVARELGRACRDVQSGIKFGIPLHVPGGELPQQALARFAYDMNAFRKLDVDFYWFAFRSFEDEGTGGRSSRKKSFEYFSRLVKSASTMQKDPLKMIIAIPAAASGKVLPLFEIEDTTALAQQAGKNTGMAYMVEQTAVPPAALTKKLFKRE